MRTKTHQDLCWHLPLLVAVFIQLWPIVFMVSTSLKDMDQIFQATLNPLPLPPTLNNYLTVLGNFPLFTYIYNTFFIAAFVTVFKVLTSVRQTMRGIPKPLLEAAVLDNAGPLQVLHKVVLPLIKPSIIAVGILFFINSWNEYFWPLLVLQDKETYTLPLALQMFISAEGGSEWGIAMAVATLTSLPPLALYLVCQKFILNTFMQSGVKG